MAVLTKKFEANSTFSFAIRWTTDLGVPWDLSDAILTVKKEQSDETPLIYASFGNGLIDIEAVSQVDGVYSGGWATVTIPPTAMDALDYYGGGFWDMCIKRTIDGSWKRAVEGPAIISKGVTHV